MAITRLGAGAGAMTAGTTATFNSFNVTTSDANTLAVVGIAISMTSATATCSVTYGGVAMTQLGFTAFGSTTNRGARALYYLFNPGTGVQSVVATPGGAAVKTGLIAQVAVYSGVDAAGVGTYSTGGGSLATQNIASVANGWVLRIQTNGGPLTSPDQTVEYLNGQTVGGDGDYATMQSAAGTGSNVAFNVTGTAVNPTGAWVVLSPYVPSAIVIPGRGINQTVSRSNFY